MNSIKTLTKLKYIAGFSLDTSMNIDEGLRKLRDKGLDLIVINSTAAFKKNYSTIKIVSRDNNKIDLIDNTKFDTAKLLLMNWFALNPWIT